MAGNQGSGAIHLGLELGRAGGSHCIVMMSGERAGLERLDSGCFEHAQPQGHGGISIVAYEGKVLVVVVVPQGRVALRRVSKGNMQGIVGRNKTLAREGFAGQAHTDD